MGGALPPTVASLMAENTILRAENSRLRAENDVLRPQVSDLQHKLAVALHHQPPPNAPTNRFHNGG